MTDVLVLQKIPGGKVGQIVPMSGKRLDSHVAAGNVKVLPNEHDAWQGDAQPDAPRVHATASTTPEPILPSADELEDDDAPEGDD